MNRKHRPELGRARRRCDRRSVANLKNKSLESLERRQLLAAHIVGSATVYATIQAAVDAAVAGQTVTVDPGNYNETVAIFKQLTIKGAQAGVDGRSNDRGVNESVVQGGDNGAGAFGAAFKINASGVVLDGFTVQGTTSLSDTVGAAIVIAPNIAGTQIINNVVQNNPSAVFMSNNSASSALLIQHNTFRLNNNAGAESGIALVTNGSLSGGNITNVTIDGNYFFKNFSSDNIEPAISFQTLAAAGQSNIHVTNNVFVQNGKAALFINTDQLTFTGNVVTGCRDTTSGGLRFEGGVSNATIQNNEFYASEARGIRADKKASSNPYGAFTVTNNLFFKNGQGDTTPDGLLLNLGEFDGTMNASNNWWGASSGPSGEGPGTGDSVFLNGATGTFSPWATSRLFDGQVPYYGAAQDVNSLIEMENVDHGGEGIAYHDTTAGNSGGRLHPYLDIDIAGSTDTDSATGYMLTSTAASEYLEYTVNVPVSGTFTFNGRVASGSSGGAFHLEIDGANVSGSIALPNTGSTSTWQTMTSTGISLPAGVHVLRVAFDTNNSGGNVGNWNWISFTPTSISQPPAAPSNLLATAANSNQVNLTWADNSNNETGFKIERKTGAGGSYALLTTTAAGITAFGDTTAQPSTTYFYRVRATNGAGDSTNSNEASATTPLPSGTVWVSDLTWVSATNGYGPVEKDTSNGSSAAGDGHTITLNGVTYAKGLGCHADSDITYNLAGAYTTFISDIGVDDETGPGTVQFQVMADGVKIYDSGTMTQAGATQTINVSVSGVQTLVLHVGNADNDYSYDHADWAGARLIQGAVAAPAAPSNLTATAVSTTQINLSWSDNSNNETGFIVERSADGSTGWTSVGTPAANATSFQNTGLTAGTKYFYRVRATNGGVDSGNSNTANATTVPAAPGTLTATAISSTQINLSWGNVSGETGYKIERSLDGSTGWTAVTGSPVAADVTTFSDTTVAASTQYFYRVRATSAAGDSANSNTANATTPAQSTAPAAPSNLLASAASATQINLTWTDNANNETGFIVERSPDGNTGWTQVGTPAANATSFSNTGLAAGTQYFYRVRAVNGALQSTNSNIANATTNASGPVTYIAKGDVWKYLDNGSNQGTVWRATAFDDSTWKSGAAELGYGDGDEATVVSYGGNANAKYITTYFRKGFSVSDPSLVSGLQLSIKRDDGAVVYVNGTEVFRTNMPTGTISYTTLASAAIEDNTFYTASFSNSLLVAGNNVIAVEIHQADATSSDISFDFSLTATVSQPSQPPAAPSNLLASAVNSGRIDLTWTDNASNETGFIVERSTDNFVANVTQVAAPAANATSFSDTAGLSPLTKYYYRVRAVNGALASANSNIANATTPQVSAPAAPSNLLATAAGQTQINLTWTDNASNESGFIVERSSDNFVSNVTQVAAPAQNATSFSDTGLTAATKYYYRVRATNAGGDSANSNIANATTSAMATVPAAPSGLAASAASSSRIDLTWTDNANNETGFIVERSTDNFVSNVTQVATPAQNATTFSDTTVLASTQYFYRVRATNAVGPSANSNIANATTPAALALPAPWTQADVGTNAVAGSATGIGNSFTVKGSGTDIWNSADGFHYVYQPWTGDGQIIVRVTGMDNTNAWAKAGVMFRESLSANSKQASLVITPSNGIVFIRRTSTGGSASGTFVSGPAAPYYLKLIRNGNTLSAYRSSNGTSWTSVGSSTVSMNASLFVGLIVCAKANVLNTATFTNVTLSTSTSSTLAPSAITTTTATATSSGTPLSATSTSQLNSASALLDAVATK